MKGGKLTAMVPLNCLWPPVHQKTNHGSICATISLNTIKLKYMKVVTYSTEKLMIKNKVYFLSCHIHFILFYVRFEFESVWVWCQWELWFFCPDSRKENIFPHFFQIGCQNGTKRPITLILVRAEWVHPEPTMWPLYTRRYFLFFSKLSSSWKFQLQLNWV